MAYEQTQKISGAITNFGKSVAISGYYAISADDGNMHVHRRGTDGIWSSIGTFVGVDSSAGDALDIGNEFYTEWLNNLSTDNETKFSDLISDATASLLSVFVRKSKISD